MRCTAVQRIWIVGFDWIFEIRVGKLMRFTCVFNAFLTRIRQGQIDGRYPYQTSKFREFMSPAIIVYYLNEKK